MDTGQDPEDHTAVQPEPNEPPKPAQPTPSREREPASAGGPADVPVRVAGQPSGRRRRYLLAGAVCLAAAIGAALVVQHQRNGSESVSRGMAPSVAQSATVAVGDAGITITSSGSLATEHHTLRVVSARRDLSGQRELAWTADAGFQVGDVRCTQNFRFNPGSSTGERPTMLVCWRTSPTRSVYVVAVDIDRRPSAQDAAATIDKLWAKLG